jgi:sialic acid synthase SpsE
MTPFDLASFRRWDAPVLVIAEAGVNHEGDLATAVRMVEEAATAGIDVVKFQTYSAERLATRSSTAYWDRSLEAASSQFELFKRYDRFGEKEYRTLADACHERGVLFLTTPFDVDVIDWLDPLQSFWKVASGDITNVPLLTRLAETRKPVLLSTGASTLDEARGAEELLRRLGAPEVALLHCTLSYPTALEDAAIASIRALGREFPDRPLGYSDHTVPPASFQAIEAAVALGARVIEKHYTLDKSLPGNDHYHAFDPADFAALRERLDVLRELLGPDEKVVRPAEEAARIGARRSVVARGDIKAGTTLESSMLDVKRPGGGIDPRRIDELVGRRTLHDIADDTTLEWAMLATDPTPSAAA